MQSRMTWTDYAKGLGIILVVIGHVARGLVAAGLTLPAAFPLADSVLYSFHMPLFFFISGLFFYPSLQRRGPVQLIASKLDTLLYPYLLWSLVQGGVMVVMSRYTSQAVSWSEVLSLWQPQFHFWFLHLLLLLFVMVTVLSRWLQPQQMPLLLLLAAGLHVFQFNLPMSYFSQFIANYSVYFVAGIVFSVYRERLQQWQLAPVTPLVVVLFIETQLLFHGIAGKDFTDKGLLTLLVAAVSILSVLAVSHWLAQHRYLRWLQQLGVYSMPVYLLHILAGSGTRIVLHKFLGIESWWLQLSVGVLAAIVLPLLLARLAQRWGLTGLWSAPLSRWLWGWTGRRRPRQQTLFEP